MPHATTTPDLFANVRTVFLDRDGVINRKAPEGEYVATWEQFEPLPEVREAIAGFNAAARRVFVVTNQRGIALGLYSCEDVERLHKQVQAWLGEAAAHVDGFYYCPHDKTGCVCRKPLPGMLEEAIRAFPEVEPATSVMIGDSLSDIVAGRALGMRTIFIEGEPGRRKAGAEKAGELADSTVESLAAAAALLGPVQAR